MTGRGIVSKPVLVGFLKEGILNHTTIQLTTMCIWVSLDVCANELKQFIDNAFRENRVDLDAITQDDIIFYSDQSSIYSYLDPVQFFEPSNYDKSEESIDRKAEASNITYDMYIIRPEPMSHAHATATRNSKSAADQFLFKEKSTLILREVCEST